jgi:hypothetical protein
MAVWRKKIFIIMAVAMVFWNYGASVFHYYLLEMSKNLPYQHVSTSPPQSPPIIIRGGGKIKESRLVGTLRHPVKNGGLRGRKPPLLIYSPFPFSRGRGIGDRVY